MSADIRDERGRGPGDFMVELREALQLTEGDMMYAGQKQRTRNLRRTGEGKDVDGQPFAPYSPAYKKRKEKIGRNANVVDLRGRNAPHMLQGVIVTSGAQKSQGVDRPSTSKAKAESFTVGLYGEEATRANAHNQGAPERNLPQRRFLGVGQQDADAILADVVEHVDARLERL